MVFFFWNRDDLATLTIFFLYFLYLFQLRTFFFVRFLVAAYWEHFRTCWLVQELWSMQWYHSINFNTRLALMCIISRQIALNNGASTIEQLLFNHVMWNIYISLMDWMVHVRIVYTLSYVSFIQIHTQRFNFIVQAHYFLYPF